MITVERRGEIWEAYAFEYLTKEQFRKGNGKKLHPLPPEKLISDGGLSELGGMHIYILKTFFC